MKKITVSDEILQEARNIADKVYHPLGEFLDEKNLKAVLTSMRLKNGKIWPMPIVLDAEKSIAEKIKGEKEIILADKKNKEIFKLSGISTFKFDKLFFYKNLFGSEDKNHPGVAKTLEMGDYLVGGKVHLLKKKLKKLHKLFFSPSETKKIFEKRKWKKVAAFQTRNPPHISHEYSQKDALTKVDGLFINPVIGGKKKGDFRDEHILGAYGILMKKNYPRNKVILGTLHTFMRYAGPKEAVFHALIRKNFGCTHMIIGRNHAGAENYYDPYAAHDIFDRFEEKELGIKILKYENAFYCNECKKIVLEKECRHGKKARVDISGNKLREKLTNGEIIPKEFVRKEVAEYLRAKRKNIFC